MNDIASVGEAIATLVLAFFTYLSVRQARDAQRALARPILIPANIPQSKEVEKAEPTNLDIENVGPGVANDVWGVLLPYSDPLPWIPPQLFLRDHLPLRPGERRRMPFTSGGTMFTSRDRVGRVPLAVPVEFAPEAGFPNPHDRRESRRPPYPHLPGLARPETVLRLRSRLARPLGFGQHRLSRPKGPS